MGDVMESGEKQWPVAGDQWGRGESEKRENEKTERVEGGQKEGIV